MIQDMKLWADGMPYNEKDLPCENRIRAYWQEDGQVHPVVIIYPGGAYHHYGTAEQLPIAEFYYAHGFHALIVYYRIDPHRYPAALADAQRAVKLSCVLDYLLKPISKKQLEELLKLAQSENQEEKFPEQDSCCVPVVAHMVEQIRSNYAQKLSLEDFAVSLGGSKNPINPRSIMFFSSETEK